MNVRVIKEVDFKSLIDDIYIILTGIMDKK
jgi:hypothetical protein